MISEQQQFARKFGEGRAYRQIPYGLLAGALIGAGLMYLFDSRMGNRRRAVARDKAARVFSRSSIVAGKTFRHLRNQLEGVAANLTRVLRPEGIVSDRKLLDRIRSVVGRSIPHPNAVDFSSHEGRVTVRGYLKPHEAGQVIQAIEKVPGVRSVDNQIVDASAGTHAVQ